MGKGKTLLMGSFPGGGYEFHHGKETRTLFGSFLSMAGTTPRLRVDDNEVQARIHEGEGGGYLWVTNPTRQTRPVTISLSPELGRFASGEDRWGKLAVKVSGDTVTVTLPARDAAVIALR
jgi:beta-galactosidase